MKKFVLIFLFLLAACGGDKPKFAAIPQGATVLILGDSLSYGTVQILVQIQAKITQNYSPKAQAGTSSTKVCRATPQQAAYNVYLLC